MPSSVRILKEAEFEYLTWFWGAADFTDTQKNKNDYQISRKFFEFEYLTWFWNLGNSRGGIE